MRRRERERKRRRHSSLSRGERSLSIESPDVSPPAQSAQHTKVSKARRAIRPNFAACVSARGTHRGKEKRGARAHKKIHRPCVDAKPRKRARERRTPRGSPTCDKDGRESAYRVGEIRTGRWCEREVARQNGDKRIATRRRERDRAIPRRAKRRRGTDGGYWCRESARERDGREDVVVGARRNPSGAAACWQRRVRLPTRAQCRARYESEFLQSAISPGDVVVVVVA